jgi:hypothetical protein
MNQINEGGIQQASSAYVKEVRGKIIDACEELLDIGARIRPLNCGKEQVGWVRGVFPSERKILHRWFRFTCSQEEV